MPELDHFVSVDFCRFSQSDATIAEEALVEFEGCWNDAESRLKVIPGKDALAALNDTFQAQYGVSITATAIIDAMRATEVPDEMQRIFGDLSKFSSSKV
jgi:hypothetical protein